MMEPTMTLMASEVALRLTKVAGSPFVREWFNQYPGHKKDWGMFKDAFPEKFAIKDSKVAIMAEL
ncbi:hypothetical protein DSO57_1006774 [Entomophthora muscae]|uniref:Uncharacterized protein n=1 Tax=Entomophthora muscae TaxID=34485 RepID=A0ACC2SA61_9FUNG|nr:hypothetical protein DSO57_1006774 [Entomophthora muscae]